VLEAHVVGTDPTTDVAVIRVTAEGLPAAPLGNSDEARVGEWVMAVGNPGFEDASTLDFTVTGGIISAKGRPLNILNVELAPAAAGYAIEDFIQTDAVINPGNSGGPLVDLRGTVIGINTAIASTTGYSQGYGFAVPANLARRVMRDLIEYGYVRRALLGVSIVDVTQEDAEVYGLERIAGVVVEDLTRSRLLRQRGSPATRRHHGSGRHSGRARRSATAPGRAAPARGVHHAHRRAIRRAAAFPRAADGGGGQCRQWAVRSSAPSAPDLGLELEELTPLLARQLGYRTGGRRPDLESGARERSGPQARREELSRMLTIDRRPVETWSQADGRCSAACAAPIVGSSSNISLLLAICGR
jgi:serine protease Do